MRVLVTGGRNFTDRQRVFYALDQFHKKHGITLIIHGNALGADASAHAWALMRHVPVEACPADWKAWGRTAGAIRNTEMLTTHKPDVVIAFPGGNGTADMVRKATRLMVTVHQVKARKRGTEYERDPDTREYAPAPERQLGLGI